PQRRRRRQGRDRRRGRGHRARDRGLWPVLRCVLSPRSLAMERSPHITVRDLSVRYGDYVVMHDVSFTVRRGDVFVIMGGSGSGKSTLLNTMIGLVEPATGEILYDDTSFTHAPPPERREISRRFGVLFQFGALWSGLTLAENVALPLEELTSL